MRVRCCEPANTTFWKIRKINRVINRVTNHLLAGTQHRRLHKIDSRSVEVFPAMRLLIGYVHAVMLLLSMLHAVSMVYAMYLLHPK